MALHTEITQQMVAQTCEVSGLGAGAKVLDVGCGQGVALELFAQRGLDVIGITNNAEDLRVCREKNLNVREMDQSFLDFDPATFDLVWCRHCLEHSVMPYFTLSQLVRVLKPGGWLYLEVPAPDTHAGHQTNRNHYSVLPKSAWIELMSRSGVPPTKFRDVTIDLTRGGQDVYWAMLGQLVQAKT
jgi:ubiquinone/menaquinone biosynthesis C-methylase UbiE